MQKIMHNVLGILALLVLALSAGFSPPAEGAVWYITPSGGGEQVGSSWENAFSEGQFSAAILSADVGDELWVALGSYRPSSDDINASFEMKTGVVLYGGFAGGEMSRDQRDWEANKTILTGDLGGGSNSKTVVTGSGTDKTAILDGFTITGGKGGSSTGYGGGMYNDGGSPTVTNCTFSDNEASDRGGAMYNFDGSSPTMTNCTFAGNEAFRGSAIYNFNYSSPTVTNCTFSGNEAQEAGAIYNYDGSSPTVTNCTFTGNEAREGGAIGNMKNSNPTVTNSVFSANKARSTGGAINNSNSSPTVTNCTFSGNEAGAGGAINNGSSSNPTVTNCTFSDNEVTHYGGAIHNDNSSPTVTDCTFSGNKATQFDGGAIYNKTNSSPTVTDCTFSGNKASKDGGAMYNDSSSPTVADCTFSGNEADEGGAMYNDSSSPTVTDCTFSGNKGTHFYGGAIYNDNSSPTVTDCTFSNNEASFNGGAMHNDSSNPTVANCTFSDNEANYGGAISNWNNSSPTVTNCTFSDNVAGKDGGAMHNRNVSKPTVTNCTFSGNEASAWGGAMHNYDDSNPTVTNCTFSDNAAGKDGGAMHNYDDSNPTVTNCTFSDNEADEGGAMYNFSSSPTIVNSILWGNSGGEIVNSGSTASPDVTYCVISGGYGGGSDIISDDPNLEPLGNYGGATKTFALGDVSSAMDKGTSAGAPSEDQRGLPRDASRDIGSYERRDDLKILTLTITGPGTVSRDISGDPLTSTNQWFYSKGDSVILTAAPISPDLFKGWDGALSGKEPSASLTMDEDRYVTAKFGDYWTILAAAGSGGTITPSGEVEIRNGADQTFTISADQGYSLLEVTVDGTSVGTPSSYTFSNVTEDHSISAVFSKKEWIIAALAGEGGTISPSGSVIVPYGESITFIISAKAPFTTEDVVVDGTSRGPLSSYTFSNVRENHDIKASFSSSEVPGGGSGCQMGGSPLSNLWLLLPLVLLRGRNR